MNNAAHSLPIPETPVLRFAGHNFEPLPSGALFWRVRQTLLVADLHFEKMASFARRGQMLPPYDTAMTLKRLEADLRRTGARELLSRAQERAHGSCFGSSASGRPHRHEWPRHAKALFRA
jgi:hypothetical protein